MPICVFGAGSIGCHVGGRLLAAGQAVSFVGRPRLATDVKEHGLRVSDHRGFDRYVEGDRVDYRTGPDVAAEAELILVTVKSGDTVEAGKTLAGLCKPDAVVISFQNGIGNDRTLRDALPGRTVLAGMVPFNVVRRADGAFHQASDGALDVEASPVLEPFLPAFEAAGLPLTQHADLLPVQWAKLLLNLNNAINALSGLPLREELSHRDWRRCLALTQDEALDLLAAAGIRPARLTPLPPRWMPHVLRLPDGIFRALASRMLAIDPLARSSTLDDLDAGRLTEVDWLNGEIVRLAGRLGRSAPVNARLAALVHAAEQCGSRNWSGAGLLAELRSAK